MLRGRGGGRRVAAGIDDDKVRARTGGRDALDDLAGLHGREPQLGCLRHGGIGGDQVVVAVLRYSGAMAGIAEEARRPWSRAFARVAMNSAPAACKRALSTSLTWVTAYPALIAPADGRR